MNTITMKDIAKAAGVSPATVSCCLTGTRNVKPETRERIMKVIEQMRYIPNSSARSLRVHSSGRIGIVLTGIDDPFYANVLTGLSSVLPLSGYTLSIAFSENSPELECQIIDDFIGQNISGLVIVTCQPDNTAFFQNHIEHYRIPSVFLERRPKLFNCNYVGYDNFKTISFFMDLLIGKNYKNIGLFCGPSKFSPEEDCIRAYRQALAEYPESMPEFIITTDFSKEDTFRKAFTCLSNHKLQAALCTSEALADGVSSAASLLNLSLQKDLAIVVLTRENWCLSSSANGITYSSKSAYQMGIQAGNLLLSSIQNAESCISSILTDAVIFSPHTLSIPPAPPICSTPILKKQQKLRVMMTELNSSNSIIILSRQFERQENIEIEFEIIPQKDVLNSIIQDNERRFPCFDLYMYDIPWLSYLAQNRFLADITDFIQESPYQEENFFSHNLKNCQFEGRYYGVPVVGGSQIMFYRKDLFENKSLREKYETAYSRPLTPPQDWEAFNITAEFFTRSFHTDAPTLYGTSIAGADSLCFAPEIFLRMLAYNGNVWDAYYRTALNSKANCKAFSTLLETCRYCEPSILETTISKTVQDFCCGKTAMLITYTERAPEIASALTQNTIGAVGYSHVPGGIPLNIGWNLGVNPQAENFSLIYKYLTWLGAPDINNYLTILDGQTAHRAPYHKYEFLRLYPWMKYTEEGFLYSKDRISPCKKNRLAIPQNKVDALLYDTFKNIYINGISIEDALEKADAKGKELLKTYGYYPTPMIRTERRKN